MKNLFWIGLALRLGLMPFFGSHFLTDLFVPFIDSSIQNLGSNPWSLNPPNYFPYGSVLFVLLFVPKLIGSLIFGSAALGATGLSFFLMKLPLLAADFLMLHLLRKVSEGRERQLLVYYWLNPVLLYTTYVFGQLDLVAMAFIVFSFLELIRGRCVRSGALLAAALLCKFHVVVLIPFMAAFLWNREFMADAFKKLRNWTLAWAPLTALGFVPLVIADRFLYASSTSPEAQRLFSLQWTFESGTPLFIGLGLVLVVLGRLLVSVRIYDRGLIFGSAILFGSILMVTPPYASWYLWVVPFISLFFVLYLNVPRALYWCFALIHPLYFIFLDGQTDGVYKLIAGSGATVLQAALLANLLAIWGISVRKEAPLAGRAKPLLIGIAGDSGSGKNRFSAGMSELFGDASSVFLEGDDYHRWERGSSFWENYTHLDPKANHLLALATDAFQLREGRAVFTKHYDHGTGKFTDAREIKPTKTVLIQGLHTLYLRRLRDTLDLKVFMSPDASVRLAWKIDRDVKDRGHSLDKVLKSFEDRARDSELHIEPQAEFADWVIRYFAVGALTREEIIEGKRPEIAVSHLLWNDLPLAGLVQALQEIKGVNVVYEHVPKDLNRVSLTVRGQPTADEIKGCADRLFSNLRHLTRGTRTPVFRAGTEGVSQLIALVLLSHIAEGSSRV